MLERSDSWQRESTASLPLFLSLAVRTTATPSRASWRATSRPIPLFAPVTTANLQIDEREFLGLRSKEERENGGSAK